MARLQEELLTLPKELDEFDKLIIEIATFIGCKTAEPAPKEQTAKLQKEPEGDPDDGAA